MCRSIIFLDEPTSGLDATSAMLVMSSLSYLSKHLNVTIVAVIHQPRAFIFELFDAIVLLGLGGNMVYHGPVQGCISYFTNLGYVLPQGENVADWLIDISSGILLPSEVAFNEEDDNVSWTSQRSMKFKSYRSSNDAAGNARLSLTRRWKKHMKDLEDSGDSTYACPVPYDLPNPWIKPSFLSQVMINIRRNMLISYRSKDLVFLDCFFCLGYTCFISLLVGPLKFTGRSSALVDFEVLEVVNDKLPLLNVLPILFDKFSKSFPFLSM